MKKQKYTEMHAMISMEFRIAILCWEGGAGGRQAKEWRGGRPSTKGDTWEGSSIFGNVLFLRKASGKYMIDYIILKKYNNTLRYT